MDCFSDLFYNEKSGKTKNIKLRDVPILIGNKGLDFLVNERRENGKYKNGFNDFGYCKFCGKEFTAYVSIYDHSGYQKFIRDINVHIWGNTECSIKRIVEEKIATELYEQKVENEYKKQRGEQNSPDNSIVLKRSLN